MAKFLRHLYFKYGALLFLIVFASSQFFLILRHKSTYLSDSYFFKHIFYQLKGDSFSETYGKIRLQVDLTKADAITRNIFENINSYTYSYSFFTKRAFYPMLAYFTNFVVASEYISFLLPVFLSYLGSIVFIFFLSQKGLNYIFTVFSTALFISFYPFLDWSTYFLTDTIGFFFWLLLLLLIYHFLKEPKKRWLYLYAFFLIISLTNREQSLLMLPLLFFLIILTNFFNFAKQVRKRLLITFWITLTIESLYLIISSISGQRTLYDTIVYTQNSYGLYSKTYSLWQTLTFILNSVILAHRAFISDLVRHHWWFVLTVFGLLGIGKTLFIRRKRLIDLLMISSGLSSYLSIFFYPVLSYRYFFPLVVTILYFAAKFIYEFEKDGRKKGTS